MLGHNNCVYDYKCNQEDLMLLIILHLIYEASLLYHLGFIIAWNSLVAWEMLHMMVAWDTFSPCAVLYCMLVWGAWIDWYIAVLSDPLLTLAMREIFSHILFLLILYFYMILLIIFLQHHFDKLNYLHLNRSW